MGLGGGTIACTSSSSCPSNLPMCDPDSHICVGCIESFLTCPKGFTCDGATHTCVTADPNAPCKRNADCPGPQSTSKQVTCLKDAGVCVECATNADCVSPDVCRVGYTCGIPDGGTTD
jgi:hypothetical protein